MNMEKSRLPVLDTLRKSIATISDNSRVLLKALLLPSIVMLTAFLGQKLMQQHGNALINDGINISKTAFYISISRVGATLIVSILSAVLAVICHRVILLGKESLPVEYGLYFSRRELKYFGWLILFSLPVLIGFMVIPGLSALLSSVGYNDVTILLLQAWSKTGMVMVTFIVTPFLLVLPATAVDAENPFSKARLAVRRNAIRLAVVLIVPMLIRILTVWALEYFGHEKYNIVNNAFIGLIVIAFMVFEAAALAVSYKTLAYGLKNT